MLNPAKKIPDELKNSWKVERKLRLRQRIWVSCLAFSGTYFLSQVLSFLLRPDPVYVQKIYPYWILLSAVMFLFMFVSLRARSFWVLKLTAYLFITFYLGFFTFLALQHITDNFFSMTNVLILMLFSISLVIHWQTLEILALTFMHLFTLMVYHVLSADSSPMVPGLFFSNPAYAEGLFYLILSGVICMVIRYHELTQETENFLLLKEIKGKNQEIERKNEQMLKELELASRIHRTLIPESITTPQADIYVTYLPVSDVGGDYAKFHFLNENRLIFMISDVTGHGVPAALLVNRIHTEFHHLARESAAPGELLKNLNRFILKDFEGTGMYLSAFCGVLDFKEKRFMYSSYGHPAQYLYQVSASKVMRLESQTSLLGIDMGDWEKNYELETSFGPGDELLLFTDGVTETSNQSGEEFGGKRLENFLLSHSGMPAARWIEALIAELDAHRYKAFQDDIFILNIRVK